MPVYVLSRPTSGVIIAKNKKLAIQLAKRAGVENPKIWSLTKGAIKLLESATGPIQYDQP